MRTVSRTGKAPQKVGGRCKPMRPRTACRRVRSAQEMGRRVGSVMGVQEEGGKTLSNKVVPRMSVRSSLQMDGRVYIFGRKDEDQ